MDLGYSGLTPRSSCRGRDPRHQSDVARLVVLEELGGLYVDLDLWTLAMADCNRPTGAGCDLDDSVWNGCQQSVAVPMRWPGDTRSSRSTGATAIDDRRWL